MVVLLGLLLARRRGPRGGELKNKLRLDCASAGEQVEDEDDHSQDEKDMDPTSEGVAADQTDQPEEEENDGDSPKHGCVSCEALPGNLFCLGLKNLTSRAACGKLRGVAMRLPVEDRNGVATVAGGDWR
jgi:hypothetical protein